MRSRASPRNGTRPSTSWCSGLIDREVRNRKGRSVASLVVLFGPIVVLVLLILFGD